jgi:hypothetical protein
VDAVLYTQLPGEEPMLRWELDLRNFTSPLPSGPKGQPPQFHDDLPGGASIYVAIHSRAEPNFAAAFVRFRIYCSKLAAETTIATTTDADTTTSIVTSNPPTATPETGAISTTPI